MILHSLCQLLLRYLLIHLVNIQVYFLSIWLFKSWWVLPCCCNNWNFFIWFYTLRILFVALVRRGNEIITTSRSSYSSRVCTRWYEKISKDIVYFHSIMFLVLHYFTGQDLNGSNLTLRSRNCYRYRHKVLSVLCIFVIYI